VKRKKRGQRKRLGTSGNCKSKGSGVGRVATSPLALDKRRKNQDLERKAREKVSLSILDNRKINHSHAGTQQKVTRSEGPNGKARFHRREEEKH